MILCADDYGISPAVSESIIELIEGKRVSATSCMVIWPEVEKSLEQLRLIKTRYDLGLHLVLTEGRPLTALKQDSGLVDEQGDFLSFGNLMKKAYLRVLNYESVLAEIEAQIQRFAEITGRDPDYIDGHQHVQQLPVVREAVKAVILSREKNRPIYTRVAGLPLPWCISSGWTYSVGFAIRNMFIHIPGHFSRKLMKKSGIPHNRYLLGYYVYEGGDRFETVFRHYLTMKPREKDIFYCHPGRTDDDLKKRDKVIASREETFKFLRSPRFNEIMEAANVSLNTFF
jgi:predicted glycoside hydrolase/deacetylase ChbG (UPF0249 family)